MRVFGRRQERVLREFLEHYHHARPHQAGIDQRRPWADEVPSTVGSVERHDRSAA
ncbi:MAG TPA: hypothetical protein VKF14_06375 [Candidatus Dormibacteraeota bacterium]|nr:hypothetical protein [Candidatus Dormibacteraeota bacterium]